MPVFVVERYLAALTDDGLRSQVEREADIARENGLRFRRSIYLRDDELCFSVFEAESRAQVVAANDRADIRYERIVEAVDINAPTEGGVS